MWTYYLLIDEYLQIFQCKSLLLRLCWSILDIYFIILAFWVTKLVGQVAQNKNPAVLKHTARGNCFCSCTITSVLTMLEKNAQLEKWSSWITLKTMCLTLIYLEKHNVANYISFRRRQTKYSPTRRGAMKTIHQWQIVCTSASSLYSMWQLCSQFIQNL